MRTNQQKGDVLEMAVHAIESTILALDTRFDQNNLLIDSKKIVVVNGVRHEIDIWVEAKLADGYDPVFIFECKNWNNPVGKNEIIIFSEKVKSVGAAKGFFVASKFTKDAIAQAKIDRRVVLLLASETQVQGYLQAALRITVRERLYAQIELRKFGSMGMAGTPIECTTVTFQGRTVSVKEFFQTFVDEAADQLDMKGLNLGEHDCSIEATKIFGKGDLIADGKEIETALLKLSFKINVFHPRIRSYFDVAKRGRFYVCEDYVGDGVHFALGLVAD